MFGALCLTSIVASFLMFKIETENHVMQITSGFSDLYMF